MNKPDYKALCNQSLYFARLHLERAESALENQSLKENTAFGQQKQQANFIACLDTLYRAFFYFSCYCFVQTGKDSIVRTLEKSPLNLVTLITDLSKSESGEIIKLLEDAINSDIALQKLTTNYLQLWSLSSSLSSDLIAGSQQMNLNDYRDSYTYLIELIDKAESYLIEY